MKPRIVVDTNVLVSFLTNRDERQQEQAGQLFREAAEGKCALILHQVVLSEMVYVLLTVYSISAQEVSQTLNDLLAMPGTLAVDSISWALLLSLWPDRIPTFADAALAAIVTQGGYDEVATFDRPLRSRLKRQGLRSHW